MYKKKRRRWRVVGKPKVLKWIKTYTGHSKRSIDKKRKALHAGKRESKYGHIYYEHRRNRTDHNYHTKI